MHCFQLVSFSLAFFASRPVNSARVAINGTNYYGTQPTSASAVTTDETRSHVNISTSGQHLTNNATASLNCSGSWSAWMSNSIDYTGATTYTKTWTYYNITASTTTLCDGHPRVIGGSAALTTIASGVNSTITSEFLNYTVPTPTCQLSPQDCSGDLWGVSSCTSIRSMSGCGQCTIYGQSVELKYFPVTTNASRNLCPATGAGSPTLCPLAPTRGVYTVTDPYQAPPCNYITSNLTTAKPSGPYIVSAGQTLYHNRVYFSLDTVYASDTCGLVGRKHTSAIVSLKSSEVYSAGGYHHGFADVGYQVNFQDFTSVPAYAYYMNDDIVGPSYGLALTDRYRFGTDFINGMSTADFGGAQAGAYGYTGSQVSWIWDEAYAPTLLMPLQIRSLDPAWASCSLNLVGLHDPPIPLTQQLTYAGPTTPDSPPTTSQAAPASTLRSDGAPATADPKPTSVEQSTAKYTSTPYTYDPSPTSTAGTSADSPNDEGSEPTNGPQETRQDTNEPNSATTDGSAPDPSPASAGPSHPQSPPASPPLSSGGTSLLDPGSPVSSTQPLPANTQPLNPEPPTPPLSQRPATSDPAPSPSPQHADPQSNTDTPDDEGHSTPAASTTNAIGGVIASIFGVQPAPTTTNALSVLESAAQTYDDGDQGAPTISAPQGQSPPPPSPLTTDSQAQPPQPITFSDGEQTRTLKPLTGSGVQGLYTMVAPEPAHSTQSDESAGYSSDALPTQPVILTGDGYTQTVQPVQGSSGLYTVIGPKETSSAFAYPTASSGSSPEPGANPSSPFMFSGPATFVAGGQTHTIRPVESSSGVFVIDGSRTLTQFAPSSTADSAGSDGYGSAGSAGAGSSSNDRAESTIASASGSLPAVVTATNDSPSSSSTAGGGGGGAGNGNADVTVSTPPESGAHGLRVVGRLPVWTFVFLIVMYI